MRQELSILFVSSLEVKTLENTKTKNTRHYCRREEVESTAAGSVVFFH